MVTHEQTAMKNPVFFITASVIIVSMSCLIAKPASAQEAGRHDATSKLLTYDTAISEYFLRRHLSVLAADSMEGRETGRRGQKMAARYLAQRYEKMGLTPVGDAGTYLQHFSLSSLRNDSTVMELYDGDELVERSVENRHATGNIYRSWGGSDSLSGEIVFAGFGVDDPGRGVRHLSKRNLRGKWVMVFQDIPHVVKGDTLINPAFDGQVRYNKIIGEKQAAGILVIPLMSDEEFKASADIVRMRYNEPSVLGLDYLDKDIGEIGPGYDVIKPELAARVLGLQNGIEALTAYRRSLIKHMRSFTPESTGFRFNHRPYTSKVTVESENVVALLEGSDPGLNDEAVVLTAHYDHVGIGEPDSTGDRIYNGADDDGSGTVALLNIAEALTRARADGYVPRRSILFLHVSGEEKGLLGSRYYSDHPVIPMEKTVVDINIDMIGRIDKTHEERGITDYAYIIGSELISSEMDSLLRLANARSGNIELDKTYNDLQDPNQFYRRSDHWNFGRFGVPFVFFFTGVHEDYHRPSDEVQKIRFGKMAKIVRTIYATAVVVANEDDPPAVDNEAFINITKTNPR